MENIGNGERSGDVDVSDEERGACGGENSSFGDETLIEEETRSFDKMNDAGMLTTPEWNSVDGNSFGERQISISDFHGDSEGDGYETAHSSSNDEIDHPRLKVKKLFLPERLNEITPAPSLVSPIPLDPYSPIDRTKLMEVNTSTPEVAYPQGTLAEKHLIWSDGHVTEMVISKTGARIPARRSARNKDPI